MNRNKKMILLIICLCVIALSYGVWQLALRNTTSANLPDLCRDSSIPNCISPVKIIHQQQSESVTKTVRMSIGGRQTMILPSVSLDTDQTFLMSDSSVITVHGSLSQRMPARVLPALPTATDSNRAGTLFGRLIRNAVADTALDVIIVPVTQDDIPRNQPPMRSPDGSVVAANPSGENANMVGFFIEQDDEYQTIDTAWLGFFNFDGLELRSYTPPELRITGTRAGQPIELLLVLNGQNTIQTLYSTDEQVQAYE